MNRFIFMALCALPCAAMANIVAWFPLERNGKDLIRGTQGELKGESQFAGIDGRNGARFDGKRGFFFAPDSHQFTVGPSFSVSAQVWVKAWPQGGTSPAGQIVFRGDDRGGCDNYSLNLGNDGYYSFTSYASEFDVAGVRAPAKLNTWQTLLGTFDYDHHQIKLYLDGYVVAEMYTPVFPIQEMVKSEAPGFSIGNVQNPPGGRHNQPFNGYIRDVRLFNSVASWDEVAKPLPSLIKSKSDE